MQPPSAGKIKRQHVDEQSPHAAAVYLRAGVLVYISQCLTALNTFFKGNYTAIPHPPGSTHERVLDIHKGSQKHTMGLSSVGA